VVVTSFVAVLPAIIPDLARRCIASMAPELSGQLLLVDNTETGEIHDAHLGQVMFSVKHGKNWGVPKVWNEGIALATALKVDYLIVVSQSIEFGAPGGSDFLGEIERRRPEWIMHAQYGWKLIAIARQFWETVGPFDEIFSPGYYEDSDVLYRAHLAGLPCPLYNEGTYDQITVDAKSAGDGVVLATRTVRLDYPAQQRKYVAKWGGQPCAEKFTTPYDDPSLDWTFTGEPPEDT
jgi:hypothetical protein